MKTSGKMHYAWWIFIACCFISAGGFALVFDIVGIYLDTVSESLSIDMGALTLWLGIESLVEFFVMPFAGKLFTTKRINLFIALAALLVAGGHAGLLAVHRILAIRHLRRAYRVRHAIPLRASADDAHRQLVRREASGPHALDCHVVRGRLRHDLGAAVHVLPAGIRMADDVRHQCGPHCRHDPSLGTVRHQARSSRRGS